jgi:hypothetical protein
VGPEQRGDGAGDHDRLQGCGGRYTRMVGFVLGELV